MEGTAVRRRPSWQVGTVECLRTETPATRSIVLDVEGWHRHRAGQHVDVRLTAEDGYQAQRSYSIASAPEDDQLMLTVERVDDGEVSTFLVDELGVGDELEFRGPIGGYFVWDAAGGNDPVLLVAGASGVVPLRAMLRHHRSSGSTVPMVLLYSARSLSRVIYRDELAQFARTGECDVRFTFTREQPDGWHGYRRRVDRELLSEVAQAPTDRPLVYVCGPTDFVETAASALIALGHEPGRLRLERFGGTGGRV